MTIIILNILFNLLISGYQIDNLVVNDSYNFSQFGEFKHKDTNIVFEELLFWFPLKKNNNVLIINAFGLKDGYLLIYNKDTIYYRERFNRIYSYQRIDIYNNIFIIIYCKYSTFCYYQEGINIININQHNGVITNTFNELKMSESYKIENMEEICNEDYYIYKNFSIIPTDSLIILHEIGDINDSLYTKQYIFDGEKFK